MKISVLATIFVAVSGIDMASAFAPGMLMPKRTGLTSLSMMTSIEEDLKSLYPTDMVGKHDIRNQMVHMLRDVQLRITDTIQEVDGGATFMEDAWKKEDPTGHGGGGRSRVLQNGKVWEKAGCNLSIVHGAMPSEAMRAANERGVDRGGEGGTPFFAVGLSCVMHPINPHCPTMHFNYRYFEANKGENWWFGGGTDLTPCYIDEQDISYFHGTLKDFCDKHDEEFYPKFKKWADDYFYIPHRKETRGVGGIFFDDLYDREPEKLYDFCKDAANSVIAGYVPIIRRHKDDPYTPEQKKWQQIRRGRYVEFNLVNDRGTSFGLQSKGRTESILMSLPETASWYYDHHPEPGSPEAKFLEVTRNPREWI